MNTHPTRPNSSFRMFFPRPSMKGPRPEEQLELSLIPDKDSRDTLDKLQSLSRIAAVLQSLKIEVREKDHKNLFRSASKN